jgi:hypothetical protein
MNGQGFQAEVDEVSALLAERLRVRGRTLEIQLRRAGRLLPRALQREGSYLVQANLLTQNPKLARMIDAAKAEAAHRNLVAHLKSIDAGAARRGKLLNLTALIAFNLLLVSGLLLWWMVAQGYV